MHDHVTKIRELLRDAVPKKKPAPVPVEDSEARMRRAFEFYEFNVGLPVVEQSPRARALREIATIVAKNNWGLAVTKFLDSRRVDSAGELCDADVEALLAHMRALVSCADTGCEPDDDFNPA